MMTSTRSNLLVRVSMLLGYCASILYFGMIPRAVVPDMNVPNSDKYLHAAVFGGLGLLTYRLGRMLFPSHRPQYAAGIAIAWAALWGGLLEVLQSLTSYRSAELGDFAADISGATLFVLLAVWLRLERPWWR